MEEDDEEEDDGVEKEWEKSEKEGEQRQRETCSLPLLERVFQGGGRGVFGSEDMGCLEGRIEYAIIFWCNVI